MGKRRTCCARAGSETMLKEVFHELQQKTHRYTLYGVGANDRRIALFENVYPVPRGVSYNSYLLLDEKTALFDTIDQAFTHQLLENVSSVLDGRSLDYLIVNHMEPDHCASIADILFRYPGVKIVCTAKAANMMKQFFEFDVDQYVVPVKEGDTLSLGVHTLTFVMAPMVHWPEVMVTYETTEKILFSADAFGSFGAIDGNIFADETDYKNSGCRKPEDTTATSSENTVPRCRPY